MIAFAAYVVVSLRHGRPQAAPPPAVKPTDPNVVTQTVGGGEVNKLAQGSNKFSLRFDKQLTYADGRTKLEGHVKTVIPKGDRTITIEGAEATLMRPPDKDVGKADFSGGVTLTTSDGVTVKAAQASYDDSTGLTTIPGALTFTKGRMRGTGVGGTYDRNREVLWVLDKAQVDVQPDEQGGGSAHVTSTAAGIARLEHYMKFTGNARIEGEGRISQADDATLYLSADDKTLQRMELRGNSRISAAPGGSGGPQEMQARDIDLAYGADGRTLQTVHLVENATLQLPGDPGKPGRRIAARGIDIALAPDGATVTALTATENVQVDLPADGPTPAKRIRAAALSATGAPPVPGQPGGLQNATFTGAVDYHEARAATKSLPAVSRSARSDRLGVKTKPGFGDVEKADFRGNVHFTDGTDTAADAPVAIYSVTEDRLDLSPPEAGEKGQGPRMTNARLQVDAAHIRMMLTSQSLTADTAVRSLLKPGAPAPAAPSGGRGAPGRSAAAPPPPPAAGAQGDTHIPAMLKQDKPVNVRANRLDYDGTKSVATYAGSARLWQEDTTIQADQIVLDDKTGNLHAITNVRSVMTLTQAASDAPARGAQPATQAASQQTTTVAEDMLYEDAKHRATYTTKAHMNGPQGDVTADKIELYLSEQGGQLERAEASGTVTFRQATRRATGEHLTYLTAKEEYTMVGTPVKVHDETPPNCKLTEGDTLTFYKSVDTIRSSGNGVAGTKTTAVPCGGGQP